MANKDTTSAGDGTKTGKKTYDAADAARLLSVAGQDDGIAFDPDYQSWRKYNGTYWQEIADNDPQMDAWIMGALQALGIKRTATMVDTTRRFARGKLTRDFHPKDRTCIAFENGTLDLDTLILRSHKMSDYLTYALPYVYQETGTTPLSDALLTRTLPDDVARRAFMAHCGLALLGDTSQYKCLVIVGPAGTGKTTLLRVFNLLLGQHMDQTAPGLIFSPNREGQLQRAIVRNWLGTALDEFPTEALKHLDEFKKMVGHGGVDSRHHYKPPVNAKWTPKILICSNDIPRFADASGAVERRMLVIKTTEESISGTPHEDITYIDRLRPELGAFASQCLTCAAQVLANNAYPESTGMKLAFKEAAKDGDPLIMFVEEECVLTKDTDQEYIITNDTLYFRYKTWAEDYGLRPLSKIELMRRIYGYKRQWGIDKYHQGNIRGVTGMELRDIPGI